MIHYKVKPTLQYKPARALIRYYKNTMEYTGVLTLVMMVMITIYKETT